MGMWMTWTVNRAANKNDGDILAPNANQNNYKSDWIYQTNIVLRDFQLQKNPFLLSIFRLESLFIHHFHGFCLYFNFQCNKRRIWFDCVHDSNFFLSLSLSNLFLLFIQANNIDIALQLTSHWNYWLNVTIIHFIALHCF